MLIVYTTVFSYVDTDLKLSAFSVFGLVFCWCFFFFLSCAFGFGCFHLSVDFQMDIFSIRRTFKWHYFHLTLNNEHATILNVAIALSGLFIPNHMHKMNEFGLWSLSCRTFLFFFVFSSRIPSDSLQNVNNLRLSLLLWCAYCLMLLQCIRWWLTSIRLSSNRS